MRLVVHAPRQVPAAFRPRIQEELDRIEKLGVVEPTSTPTEWVSLLVTVVKLDKIRLCIDPKDLNEAVKREYSPMKTVDDVLTRLPDAKIFSTLDATSGFWQIPLDKEIEQLVKSCSICNQNKPQQPLKPHPTQSRPCNALV